MTSCGLKRATDTADNAPSTDRALIFAEPPCDF